MPRVLLALAALAAVAYVAGATLDVHALRLFAKPWPVVLLGAWTWRSAPVGPYRRWILLGLGASLIGDMLLELDPEALFVPGLVAFLIAHVLYVLAYLSDTRALAPLRSVPGYAYGALMIAALWPGLGALAAPVAIYTLVICTMLWRAAARLGAVESRSARLALAGAVVFALSDSMIALRAFGEHLPGASLRASVAWGLGIMATYWLGQWGIAASAVRRTAREP